MIEFAEIMEKIKEIFKNSVLFMVFLLLCLVLIFSVRFPLNRQPELSLRVFFMQILPAAGFTALTLYLPAFYSKNNRLIILKLLISVPLLSLITALFLSGPQIEDSGAYSRKAKPDTDIFYLSEDKVLYTIGVEENLIQIGILADKTVYSSDIDSRNEIELINSRRYAMPDHHSLTLSGDNRIYRKSREDRLSVFFNSLISNSSELAEDIQSLRFKGFFPFFISVCINVLFLSMISAFFSKTRWPIPNYLFSQAAVMVFLWINTYIKRIPVGKNMEQYLPLDFYTTAYLVLSFIMLIHILFSSRKSSGRLK